MTVRGLAASFGTAKGRAAIVAAEPSTAILVNKVNIFGAQDFFDAPDKDRERSR